MPFTYRYAALAAFLFFAGCGSGTEKSAEAAFKTPDSDIPGQAVAGKNLAPNFTLRDADGKTVKLSDYKGKVVLLNFWATWCGPCRIEIPWFVEFQKTYKDKGFSVIGVALDDEGWEVVKPYIAEKQMNYPVVVGTPEVEQHYGNIDSLPTTFLIDRAGRITGTHIGLVSKKQYADDIERLLQ